MNKKVIMIVVPVIVIAAAVVVYFTMFANKEPVAEYDMYSPGDPFVTNVSGGNNLLKTGIMLELDSESMQEELTAKNVLIRDTIIFILRDLTVEDIKSPDGPQKLKDTLVEKLNAALDTTHIIGIMFTDFVMQ